MKMWCAQVANDLLIHVLKISFMASGGIVLIAVVSPILNKKHTVFWRYVLWILLAVRLILPIDFSIASLAVDIPVLNVLAARGAEEPAEDGAYVRNQFADDTTAAEVLRGAENEMPFADSLPGQDLALHDSRAKKGEEQVKTASAPIPFITESTCWASVFWLSGMAVFFVWQLGCYAAFCGNLRREKRYVFNKGKLPVYRSSLVVSPMLVGVVRPQILLPAQEYGEAELNVILDHEYAHYKRKDLWAKLLLSVARTIHWFNPFVAAMERQAVRDMELLCDGDVVKKYTKEEKKQYSETLLACASASGGKVPMFCTSEFSDGKNALKERFANIFSGKRKRGVWAALLGAGILLSVSLFVAVGGAEKSSVNAPLRQKDFSGAGMGGQRSGIENDTEDTYLQHKTDRLFSVAIEEVATAVYGSSFPRLLYASDERAVVCDDWGLLVYDIKNQKIEQLLDLKAAGIGTDLRDGIPQIEVSEDGRQMLFCGREGAEESLLYDVDERRLTYADVDGFREHGNGENAETEESSYVATGGGNVAYLSRDSLVAKDGSGFHVEQMQGLCLIVAGANRGDVQIYPLFREFYEARGEEAAVRLRWEHLRSVIGKKHLYEDEDGWNYYLEEDVRRESPLWDIAGVLEPLLLTRYRAKERQVLENLICEETWTEQTVLFSKGRIVYQAASAPDINSIKQPALVSIAMDGSGRTVADDILYHTFDGLCEDGGWIYYSGWTNDNAFPKPLCRIAPDFSGGPQYVTDIPGLLCGVMDGFVFYMADQSRKPGVWKRDLNTGDEQIHEKWGESAESFCYFCVEEKIFPAGKLREEAVFGCQILFTYDYDDEVRVSNVPFY